jgi:hypothetical protein
MSKNITRQGLKQVYFSAQVYMKNLPKMWANYATNGQEFTNLTILRNVQSPFSPVMLIYFSFYPKIMTFPGCCVLKNVI